jgi:DNA-directed RNA polymerase specialized sigma24 family protein
VLRTDLPDHRRASDSELLTALHRRDPLALAEAYHRTIPAAHAVARRVLSSSAEVEAVLREVYSQLWTSPPEDAALEAWVRARCFSAAADDLRERDVAPAAPSLTALLPELPRPEVRYLDSAERALSELPATDRRVLLLAHDKGVPSEEHDVPDAGPLLVSALLALAGPEAGADTVDPQACADLPLLGDYILGLLPPSRAANVAKEVGERTECAALTKALRRGRRRLEGLPPTPDMGQRVLVVVLAGAPAPVPVVTPAMAASGALAESPAMPSALDTGDILAGVGTAGPRRDMDDDTGEIPPVSQDPGGRPDPYAELAELDAAGAAGETTAAPDATHDLADVEGDDEAVDRPAGRSLGGRLVVWLLGALFLIAGVAAGLYLGLTLLS